MLGAAASGKRKEVRHVPNRARRRLIGEPLNFRSLARTPVNELGVVYLFGVLHDELGLQVESIQSGFPDCTARRRVRKDRSEELRIEFEFASSAFPAHGHEPTQVDMIVCWLHDWAECPENVEVLELSRLMREKGALVAPAPAGKGRARAGAVPSGAVVPVPPKKRPLSTYQKFAREQRLAGKSMAEIAQLWKRRTGASGG